MYAVAAVLPELGFLRSGLVKLCAAVGMLACFPSEPADTLRG